MTRADRGFVVFLLTGEGSLLTQLLTTSKQWNADQGMVNGKYLPLRHVLIKSLFTELNQRFAAVMNDANRIAEANQKGLLKEGCWPRFRWNSEQHKMEIDDLRTPISMQDTKTLILEVLQDLEDMTTVLKFNAKPGLTDQPRNGRVVLMLEISHFAPRLHQNVLKALRPWSLDPHRCADQAGDAAEIPYGSGTTATGVPSEGSGQGQGQQSQWQACNPQAVKVRQAAVAAAWTDSGLADDGVTTQDLLMESAPALPLSIRTTPSSFFTIPLVYQSGHQL